MEDCGILFYRKEVGYDNTAGLTDFIEVISLQIHNHQEFALVIFAIRPVLYEAPHLPLADFAASASSLIGRFNFFAVDAKQSFHGSTDYLIGVVLQVGSERRRIISAQPAKEGVRRALTIDGQRTGKIGNINVTGYKVVHQFMKGLSIFIRCAVRMNC